MIASRFVASTGFSILGFGTRSRNSRLAITTASGLLISWATPAARVPAEMMTSHAPDASDASDGGPRLDALGLRDVPAALQFVDDEQRVVAPILDEQHRERARRERLRDERPSIPRGRVAPGVARNPAPLDNGTPRAVLQSQNPRPKSVTPRTAHRNRYTPIDERIGGCGGQSR
jgi:hypothetical protein